MQKWSPFPAAPGVMKIFRCWQMFFIMDVFRLKVSGFRCQERGRIYNPKT